MQYYSTQIIPFYARKVKGIIGYNPCITRILTLVSHYLPRYRPYNQRTKLHFITIPHELLFNLFNKQLPEGVTLSFCTALKHIDKYNPTAHIIKRKVQALQPQIAALRECLKDRDRKERQRRHSTLLTILYKFQLLWASLPWHHSSEPVREYAGFTLTTGLPSPAAFTDAYYGYLWKSRRGNYFFDVGKFNPETESFSSMFNSLGTEIKLASIMAYREIE